MEKVKKIIDVNAHIVNIECKVMPANDGSKVAYISFDNLGYGEITAVKFNAKGYNSFGDVVLVSGNEKFLIIIQDISIKKNTTACDIKVKLPCNEIKTIELEENQICFEDGTITTYEGKKELVYEQEKFTLEEQDQLELNALKDVFDSNVTYNLLKMDNGWVCACGRYNTMQATECSLCGHSLDEVENNLSEKGRKNAIEEKIKLDEQRRIEADRQTVEKKKANKYRNIKIEIGVIAALFLILFVGRAAVLSGRTTYSSEKEMRRALQGTYTYYNSFGEAEMQIVISVNKVIYRYSNSDYDVETEVKKWDYKNGEIHTFEDLIVTDEGYLKDGDYIYKKGGYMSDSSEESIYSALSFSDIEIYSNSSHTICTGTVTNNGDNTYKYVKIKGLFEDSYGTVLATDSTYAIGSEGLEPGKSITFRMSVRKNDQISSCRVSIYNYD